jgi:hypothetical protein
MICYQVTLSADAEWPKVADTVIEAENAMAKCKALSLVCSRPLTQTNHLSVSESVLER